MRGRCRWILLYGVGGYLLLETAAVTLVWDTLLLRLGKIS